MPPTRGAYSVENVNGHSALSVYLNFGGNGSRHDIKQEEIQIPRSSGVKESMYSLTSGAAARAEAT